MKEYIFEVLRKTSLKKSKKKSEIASVALDIKDLLQTDLSPTSEVNNVYSLILVQKMELLDALCDKLMDEGSTTESIREKMWELLPDNEFIQIFYEYGKAYKDFYYDKKIMRNILISKGGYLFLPLMKLYKKYLNMGSVCITIDEFEDLQNLVSEDRQKMFFESIRACYDTLSKAYQDLSLPSFKMIILCTLSYWEELARETLSRSLETRVQEFEIPQLIEDEIVAMAEKLHVLYKKSGKLKHEFSLDFTKTPKYLVKIAGIENPLTPRFVIKELIRTIEEPAEYIGFISQQQ